jgi:hypothetical protein
MGLDYVLLYRRNGLCALVMLLLFFDAYFGFFFLECWLLRDARISSNIRGIFIVLEPFCIYG